MLSDSMYIYSFDSSGSIDGDSSMSDRLGRKGANLSEMCKIGVPVPPGFIISSQCCVDFDLSTLHNAISNSIRALELSLGKNFGEAKINPFIVAVRSGSKYSMPGMMDTILNVGLNDTCLSLKNRFINDCYRRLIQMYAVSVFGMDGSLFENIIEDRKFSNNLDSDSKFDVQELESIISEFKGIIKSNGCVFPQDPFEQLFACIESVFRSWNSERAVIYRNANNIPDSIGTAVVVQSMVFGNFNFRSASGVVFSRNPSTGEKGIFGEYLVNSQGEDVVSGIRTPSNASETMKSQFPEQYSQLIKICDKLESHYGDMQDIEFTIDNEKLWILQTRSAKRSHVASIKVAIDMVFEGLISKPDAIMSISSDDIEGILHSSVSVSGDKSVLVKGLPASPGAVSGRVALTLEEAVSFKNQNHNVILVRNDTSPEDINGLLAADGILTVRGGVTSHAAVVARGMGKVCVCGASGINIYLNEKNFRVSGKVVASGDMITIDGATGNVFLGMLDINSSELPDVFDTLMKWIDGFNDLTVMANADTVRDVSLSLRFCADGVGLCRTEHMFFDSDRINTFRHLIVMYDHDDVLRNDLLKKIYSWQESDFKKIFALMKDKNFTVRLLDPPLHEFLPKDTKGVVNLANDIGVDFDFLDHKLSSLRETNPMLGHRGCRLGVTHPEIYKCQISAILSAANYVIHKYNCDFSPSIMIPFVMCPSELRLIHSYFLDEIQKFSIKCNFGVMIELPSAVFYADKLAEVCDFFSFGTNDLTQTSLGLSRDDSGVFLKFYSSKNIAAHDPFLELDLDTVGELMLIAQEKACSSRPDIKLGICGEHGRTKGAVDFSVNNKFNYISCTPYAIPSVKLLSAQSCISSKKY